MNAALLPLLGANRARSNPRVAIETLPLCRVGGVGVGPVDAPRRLDLAVRDE